MGPLIAVLVATSSVYATPPTPIVLVQAVNGNAITETSKCRCVVYLREKYNINLHGDADTLTPNAKLAQAGVGSVILLHYKNVAHVVYAIGITATGWVVDESNFTDSCAPDIRVVAFDDPHITGYIIV